MVSFHEGAIPDSCHRALDFLEGQAFLTDYYLAGGTALALQIGHRVSTDLDWFSATRLLKQEERDLVRAALAGEASFTVASEQDGMLFARVFATDVSFIHQQHPLLEATVAYRGFHLASPLDIGLMKLAAINSRGTRRDFVDLYWRGVHFWAFNVADSAITIGVSLMLLDMLGVGRRVSETV